MAQLTQSVGEARGAVNNLCEGHPKPFKELEASARHPSYPIHKTLCFIHQDDCNPVVCVPQMVEIKRAVPLCLKGLYFGSLEDSQIGHLGVRL